MTKSHLVDRYSKLHSGLDLVIVDTQVLTTITGTTKIGII